MHAARTTALAIALTLLPSGAFAHSRPVSHRHNDVAVVTLLKSKAAARAGIELRVRERATKVWVDGVYRGTVRELARRDRTTLLEPGVRRVRLELPDGTVAAREVAIAPGTVVRLGIDLR